MSLGQPKDFLSTYLGLYVGSMCVVDVAECERDRLVKSILNDIIGGWLGVKDSYVRESMCLQSYQLKPFVDANEYVGCVLLQSEHDSEYSTFFLLLTERLRAIWFDVVKHNARPFRGGGGVKTI